MSAAFSPDGKRIVTASDDKTARLLRIFPDTQELVADAKAASPRCLTAEQRSILPASPSRPPGASSWRNGLTTRSPGNSGSARHPRR